MGKTIRLTEADLVRIVNKIISEADFATMGGKVIPRDFVVISGEMSQSFPYLIKKDSQIKFDNSIARVSAYPGSKYPDTNIRPSTPPTNTTYNFQKPWEVKFMCGKEMSVDKPGSDYQYGSGILNTPDSKALSDFLTANFCKR